MLRLARSPWSIGVALLILFAAGSWAGSGRIERAFGLGEHWATSRKASVIVVWQESRSGTVLHLRIPRAYLIRVYRHSASEGKKNFPGVDTGGIGMVSLQAWLPDIRPGRSPQHLPNQLSIDLSARTGDSQQQLRMLQFEQIRRQLEQPNGLYRLPDEFGLEHYRAKVCAAAGPGTQAAMAGQPRWPDDTAPPGCHDSAENEIFVSRSAADGGFYACSREMNFAWSRCTAYLQHGIWHLQYSFLKSELPRWREFDRATRKLLESLRVR